MSLTIDTIYSRLAERLPDEVLAQELARARRELDLSVRTRKEMARHRVYCLECELKRRADQRDARSKGLA